MASNYDPKKAHEYYEKNKKLKGRRSTKGFDDDQKKMFSYVKNDLKQRERAEKASASAKSKTKKQSISDNAKSQRESISASAKAKKEAIAEKAKAQRQAFTDSCKSKVSALRDKLKGMTKEQKEILDIFLINTEDFDKKIKKSLT